MRSRKLRKTLYKQLLLKHDFQLSGAVYYYIGGITIQFKWLVIIMLRIVYTVITTGCCLTLPQGKR